MIFLLLPIDNDEWMNGKANREPVLINLSVCTVLIAPFVQIKKHGQKMA